MDGAQTRFACAAQVFDRIFNQDRTSGVYPFMGQDVAHQCDRGFWPKTPVELHLFDPPQVIEAAQDA